MSVHTDLTNNTSNGGFLSGFIETSIEIADDGLNVDCIVHYAGNHSKYEMTVKLVNGKREGEAVIVHDGMPYLRLEYKQGSLTGIVERLNESGMVDMRGHLVNGVESGFFEEYDSSDQVIWRGYYKNGERDTECRLVRKGKNNMRSIEKGEFYELNESGVVTQLCLYENGLRSRVIVSFEGDVMTELDANEKEVYEGGFKGDMENGFVRNGEGMEWKGEEGSFGEWKDGKKNGLFYEIDEDQEIERICLFENGEMKRYQEFSGSSMGEYDENGRIMFKGKCKGDLESGFVRDGFGVECRMVEKTANMSQEEMAAGYWENGKKNGMFYELNEEMKATRGCWYENDEMVRVVQVFNGSVMTEYDFNGKKVYEGVYYGTVKSGFFCHEPIPGMKGFFKEVDSNGELICVSEYDGLNVHKNGECFELENGRLKRVCLYENDEMIQVIMEFNGSTVTEYNENGKRAYKGKFSVHDDYVREGKGKEYGADGETIVYSGSWRNGSRSGKGTEYQNGHAVYIGKWINGLRNGKGKEMDENGNVVYEGEWSDGKRNGMGKERMDNQLSLFGRWKDGKKSGLFYERDENGMIKRGRLYENDEMKEVIQECELYDMVLSRNIDIPHLDPYSFLICNITNGHTYGAFQVNKKRFSVEWLMDTYCGFMVDMDSKEVTYCKNDKRIVLQSTIEMIDLDASGRRWEGSVKNGKPCGYGVLYDEEGKKEYEGFMIGKSKICYGIEYYSDIGREMYKGCYYINYQFGRGVSYDRSGAIAYDGLWNRNEPYSFATDDNVIDDHTKSVGIPNNSFNESESFILRSFIHSLKRIVIGDNCFGKVRFFELDGLSELRSVVIGQKSFRINMSKRGDGSCRIVNCPLLQSIHIGVESFYDYHSFEVNNLHSLQSIDIGWFCFKYAPSFSLIGLIDCLD